LLRTTISNPEDYSEKDNDKDLDILKDDDNDDDSDADTDTNDNDDGNGPPSDDDNTTASLDTNNVESQIHIAAANLPADFDNNDLTLVEGIGPTTARKFKEVGIVSVIDLAAADVDELDIDLNSSKETAQMFIAAAKKVIKDVNKRNEPTTTS
jgi:DNA repair protein RadA